MKRNSMNPHIMEMIMFENIHTKKMLLRLIFGVAFVVAVAMPLRSSAQVNQVPDNIELAVLKNIYDSLQGAGWTTKTNWPTAATWPASATSAQFGTWWGVTVTNGDITQIALRSNNAIGVFPNSITQLTKLTYLYLDGNKITGSIPTKINRLTLLQRLYLNSNQMSGILPTELGSLSALQILYLNSNNFSGAIPSSLANLTNLTGLYLSTNGFTSVPDLSPLNKLTALTLGALPSLAPGPIYPWLSSMTTLSYLEINASNRTGTLDPIYPLINLRYLYAHGNSLTGTISPAIGNLTQLWEIYLNTNQLTGNIPAEIGNLTSLRYLQFATNQLTGSIPASVGNLTNLTGLILSYNQLTGEIPVEIGNLKKLATLYVHFNKLTGSIPAELTTIPELVNLYGNDNKLTGSIPASIGNLKKLVSFNFSNNLLTGSLPESLGTLPVLDNFNVANNKLSGMLPSSLGNLPNIKYLYLQTNSFEGELPSSIGNLTKLVGLNVGINKLSGQIPSSFANLTKLQQLTLQYNNFTGNLPAFIGNYIDLLSLVINVNQFTGPFPSEISNCTKLTTIYGENNKFTSLPASMLTMPVLATVRFTGNELTSIPAFQNHPNKANMGLMVGTNRLDFSFLEPIAQGGLASFAHSIQQPKDLTSISITYGQPFTIPSRPGNFSSMTWQKWNGNSWVNINASNQDGTLRTFYRASASAADEGLYRWLMYNSVVTGTYVQSEPIEVKTATTQALDTWAFQYQYDSRNRMIGKKVPGADWTYMVYDDRDRLVLSQDGELRKSNKWMFTKYDALNRPIMTGVYTHTAYATQQTMAGLVSTTQFFETYNGVAPHGYTLNIFPKVNLEVLTVTYYDNYNFKTLPMDGNYDYVSNDLNNQFASTAAGVAFDRVKGQVTATKTKVLPSQHWYLWNVNYYDDKGRVVQSIASNIKSGTDRVTNVYDFPGKVLETKMTSSKQNVTWNMPNGLKPYGGGLKSFQSGLINNTATSVESCSANANCWFEITVSDYADKWFGLDPGTTSNTDIDHAFYIQAGLHVYENNSSIADVGIALGDQLRIERVNGVVTYKKNGQVIATSQQTSTAPLKVHVFAVNANSYFENVQTSFTQKVNFVVKTFKYDHAARLTETWHSINGQPKVLLASNEYNELGQLITKKLHSTADINAAPSSRSYKQQVDYRYNIRGWLSRINNSDLSKESAGNAAEPGDYFGMNLGYNDDLGLGTFAPQYNGNISAIKYSANLGFTVTDPTAPTPGQRGYKFGYDAMNRLKDANAVARTSAWNDITAYKEGGLTYDLNGNILALTRTGDKGSNMDNLTYAYNGNQLLKVSDGGDKSAGFKDGLQIDDDYTYDANGNMIMDKNKSINSGGIKYNYLNLPMEVAKSTNEKVVYVYDAAGRKLAQDLFSTTGTLTKRTNYVGDQIFENDTLKIVLHDEGRITPETNGQYIYDYNLKDHLGNVRLTFTTKVDTARATATMETANVNQEQGEFVRYNNVRRVLSKIFDNTNGAADGYSVRLSGRENEVYGLAKSLSVMPGDVINMEVFAKYVDSSPSNTQALNDFISSLANIASLPAGVVIDGAGFGSSTSSFNYAGYLNNSNSPGAPKAYLNWLVFDRNYIFKEGGFVPVTTAAQETGADGTHERLSKENLLIKEPGYVYIYFSNESTTPVEVFFDDFKVEYIKSPVIQMDEYYPFGLTFNSYNRENSVDQNFKFQGQEHIDDLDLGWDSFKWRNHQPEIGRFFNIDPLAEKYVHNSPYAFSENKVTSFIELEGLEAAPIPTPGVRTAQFAARHPLAALGIGSVSPGTVNISTNVVRFTTRGSGPESRNPVLNEPRDMGNEGTQVNAMRHTLWQASITTIFGERIANEIGRAHENNPNAIDGGLAEGANFATRGLADESVDLANNVIGREIGNANPEMGMKDLALQVLETFKTDGLWTATRQEDGTFSVSRTKITDEQYKTLKAVFQKLDNNGMTDEERKQHYEKYKTSNPNVK